MSISNVRWSSGGERWWKEGCLACQREGDRVSRVETMVGYSLWCWRVGRRRTGHVVEMCCVEAVIRRRRRGIDRLLMKRINQEADEALREREWWSRARVQTRDHEQNSCGHRHTRRLLGMVRQWFTDIKRFTAGHVRLK